MRIAYICADPGVPVFGSKGCSIHVQEIVRAMLAKGAVVELFVARTGGKAPQDLERCIVHELKLPPNSDTKARERDQILWNQRAVSLLNERPAFSLVYERHSIWSAGAMCWAKRKGIDSVLEVNAPLIDEQLEHRELCQTHLAGILTGNALRNASITYVVSDAIVPYCRRFISPSHTLHVIPNGVNTQRFSPKNPAADHFEGFTVGFIGSLKPWHGMNLLIEAFSRFDLITTPLNQPATSENRSRLLIVGDGPERVHLEDRLQAQPGLKQKVQFVGAVPPQDVPSWIRSMDVAVAPYPQLGNFYFSPLKIYEYMASGRAVLGSSAGQICDVVQHRSNGFLYSPGDLDQLVQALVELRANPTLRAKLGSAARDTAIGHSWRRVLEKILSAVRENKTSRTNTPGSHDEIQV